MSTLKLTIDLVPRTSWYQNLRTAVGRPEWDRIRRQAYADYGHRCGVCGAAGMLNCHELWAYDDTSHVQRSAGFIALCTLCHHVKHIGHAGILASQGKLDFNTIIAHFMHVNAC